MKDTYNFPNRIPWHRLRLCRRTPKCSNVAFSPLLGRLNSLPAEKKCNVYILCIYKVVLIQKSYKGA